MAENNIIVPGAYFTPKEVKLWAPAKKKTLFFFRPTFVLIKTALPPVKSHLQSTLQGRQDLNLKALKTWKRLSHMGSLTIA